jgi:ubiquinone/menaquinone biosynthesis C-methylase UbiE
MSYEVNTRRHYQDEKTAREYHDQFTRWSLRHLSHGLVASAERRAVRRLLESIRHQVTDAIDVPCGTGKLVPVFRKLGLSAIEGDVSAPMMVFAREQVRRAGLSSPFVRLDITALPFASACVDVVVCLRLLHRVPLDVKVAALREMFRVSRRFAIVSYGVASRWHNFRQAIRMRFARTTSVPEPLDQAGIERLLYSTGWHAVRGARPLPVLSAEEIVLMTKTPPATGV